MKYTLKELQKALADFELFINQTSTLREGTPIRLIIARDCIKKEIEILKRR
jgi:hypothetical protein